MYFNVQTARKPGLRTTSQSRLSTYFLSQNAGRVTIKMCPLFLCLNSRRSSPVTLSRSEFLKDDRGVMLSPKRMTESTEKDDPKNAKDDKTGGAYKEELFQEPIPEPNSTTATNNAAEFPPEFARLMDQEITLDDGALRRLWQEAHAIVPDATGEEIHHFFHDRARAVYRNRKLDNPTGLMLSSIRD
jgi:hypothetical protein